MPDRKKKKNPQGNNSFLDDFVIIEGPESGEHADNQSAHSMPPLRRSAGNEFNRQEGAGGNGSNESLLVNDGGNVSGENIVNENIVNENIIGENNSREIKPERGMAEKDYRDEDGDDDREYEPVRVISLSDLKGPADSEDEEEEKDQGQEIVPQVNPQNVPQPGAQNAPQPLVSPLGASWGYDEVAPDSMVQNKPRRNKKKRGDDGERIYNDPPIEGLEEIDLGGPGNKQAPPQEQPKAEGGYSFPAEHKPRTKVAWTRAGYDRFTVIAGKTTAIPVTLIGGVYFLPKWAVSAVKLHNAKKTMQEKKEHDVIPGWNGAKFRKSREDTGAHILLDQRRVPTVWARMTGARAEDGNGNPAPPEVSVYFDQPKEASSQSMVGTEMGHSMLGVEFSRFSRFTNRYERYIMKYGFYMAGGFTGPTASNAMANRNALVPGELHDDYTHMYTVSRRYKATPTQVNSIVKASETYADGGYGYYRRNCTTFVKEMVVDVGKLETDGTIFEKEDARYTFLNNFMRWGGATFDAQFNASMNSYMARVSGQDDLSYQGYGNKRMTKQDLKNYNDTNSLFTLHPKTYAPAVAAENARRLSGKNSGVLGSFKYAGSLGKNVEKANLNLSKLQEALSEAANYVAGCVTMLLPEEQRDPDNGMPAPVLKVIQDIYEMSNSSITKLDTEFDKIRVQMHREKASPYELLPADRIRECRQKNTEEMEKASNLYRDFFRMDERLYIPFANLFSIYELCNKYLDMEYRSASKESFARGDLGNIREEMTNTAYAISSGTAEAYFTPTHYESYIQIYKDPKKAIEAYARYNELKAKKKAAEEAEEEEAPELTKAEKEELQKLQRMEDLADDFDRSHNYLLEKQAFSQQDIDYVFRLRRSEQHGIRGEKNEMLTDKKDSASIYQALFLEKIFGGMRDAWTGAEKLGGVSAKDRAAIREKPDAAGTKKAAKWMDAFLGGRTEQKQKGMKMILRGIYRSASGHTKDTMQRYVWDMFQDGYLKRVANGIGEDMGLIFDSTFIVLMSDKKNKFPKLIRSLSGEVIDEAAKAEKEAQAKAKAEKKRQELEAKKAKKKKK
ncbi:MAG: hypothetical protein J5947_01645 [Clostridium sp.]|nr:hypothetical protein [Clostridium sp.]